MQFVKMSLTGILFACCTGNGAFAAGTYTQLYAFTGGADGALPDASVAIDGAGNIFGEAGAGGTICPAAQFGTSNHGCGTLYKITPGGQLTTLLTFTGPNGAGGTGTPAIAGDTLYATASEGGTANDGVIFSVHTDGTGYQLLHEFSGRDGIQPRGPLIPAKGGGFYGITYYGGYTAHSGFSNGTLFKVGPNGKLITLYAFHGKDGAQPNALLISAAGTLYGSTIGGGTGCRTNDCGTIFSYDPASATFTTLYQFTGKTDGEEPSLGSIDAAGTLYGATAQGGPYRYGTLFSLATAAPPYAPTLLHGFGKAKGPQGYGPLSGPTLLPNNTLIGTTFESIYFFDSALPFDGTTLQQFSGGSYLEAQPVIGPHGTVIGPLTVNGTTPCLAANGQVISADGCGVIYSESR